MTFQKAQKTQALMRVGLVGTAGSGKTLSALLIAQGLGKRIAMIDTERGSGSLYADKADYDICTLEPPFEVAKYLDAIRQAEVGGYDVIIIDSLSHAWAGAGGLLEFHGLVTETKARGNSYAAWREVTPLHNKLVDSILQSSAHVIATMRAKTEYVQSTDERGKTMIRKAALAPVQREGMDYEFTLVLDIDISHQAAASKDRTGCFDGKIFMPSVETGQTLKAWLSDAPPPAPAQTPPKTRTASSKINDAVRAFEALGITAEQLMSATGIVIFDLPHLPMLRELYKAVKAELTEDPTIAPETALSEAMKGKQE